MSSNQMQDPPMRVHLALLTIGIVACASLGAQTPSGTPFRIERLDPALDAIIAPDAKLEELASGFALTEGPVWVGEGTQGYLLFSDNAGNVIYKYEPGKPITAFLEKSGLPAPTTRRWGAQTVMGRVPILLIGSNGLALDPQGRLVVTAMNDRTVYRLEQDGTRTVLADRHDGKRFNGPNDIVIESNGAIYFTDSVWGLRGAANDPARELPYSGLPGEGREGDVARWRQRHTRHVSQRRHSLARRAVLVCDCWRRADDALRHPAG